MPSITEGKWWERKGKWHVCGKAEENMPLGRPRHR